MTLTSALDGGAFRFHAPTAFPRKKKKTGVRSVGGCVGFREFRRGVNLLLLPGFEPRTVQPLASRCTGFSMLISFKYILMNLQHITINTARHLGDVTGRQMVVPMLT